MNKRGQITFFIIAAVVLVVLLVFFTYLQGYFTLTPGVKEVQNVPQELKPAYEFVQSCVKQTTEQGIILLGKQGGYYKLNDVKSFENIAYYFYVDQTMTPTLDILQQQLNMYIEENLPNCVNNGANSGVGALAQYELEAGSVEASAKINPTNVEVTVTYPIKFKTENTVSKLENFGANVEVRLGEMFSFAEKHINELQINYPKAMVISDLDQFALEKNYKFYIDDKNNPDMIFNMVDEVVKVNAEPYTLKFVNKYEWEVIE